MYKRRILAKLLVITLCLGLVLTGCGTKGTDSASKGTSTASSSSVGSSTASTSASKDTLTFALSSDIDNFDPYTNQTLTFIKTFGYNCYEPLLHIGANMEYVPDLATEWEHPDNLTYIFKLRQGVKFHNGQDMTAEDVKFSFERTQDKALGSWLGAFFSMVDKIEVVDPSTVKIHLKSISNTFLDDVSMLRIVKKGTEGTLKQNPVGTGPFKFVKWSPNDNITLEKFADYWDASNVKLNKLVLKPIPDKKIQLTNLASGDVDLVEDLPVSEINSLKSNPSTQVIQSSKSNNTIEIEVGRHNRKELANPKVMEALAYALDKETINKTVFNGLAGVIWSPFPSGVKFYKDIKQDYDLDKAKQLLSEAGYPNGLSLTLITMTGFTDWEKIAIIWQADLQKIGVKLEIKKEEMSQWLDAYLGRKYDLIINQYPMAGSDPATYCNIILSQLDKFQLKDHPELIKLMNDAKVESDQNKRATEYAQIQDMVFNIKPNMSVVEVPFFLGASSSLQGVVINPVGHTILKGAYFK